MNHVPAEAHEIVCHDPGRADLHFHFARTHDVRVFVGGITSRRWRQKMLGVDTDWFIRQAPCEVAFYSAQEESEDRGNPLRQIVFSSRVLPTAP